jgi:hypothetical protein
MIKHKHQRRDDQNGAGKRERLHKHVFELAPIMVGEGHFLKRQNEELRMQNEEKIPSVARISFRFCILHSKFFICFSAVVLRMVRQKFLRAIARKC